jgi:ribosomal protein S27E
MDAQQTVPAPSLRPIRTCNGCGQATTEYTEHDVFGTTHVVCSTCATSPDEATTPTGKRADARTKIAEARRLVIEAAALVDGDYPTIRHNCTTAIVALDDVAEAISTAIEADLREWAIDHNELGKDPS